MSKQLPPHLQAIFDKRNKFLNDCGCNQDPAEFLIKCKEKSEKSGNDNALIHAII